MSKNQILKNMIDDNSEFMLKALLRLEYSYEKAKKINLQKENEDSALEIFEAFSARFARAADIFTQKLLRGYFRLIREDYQTFIDMAELSEKTGLVENSSILILFRDLRNRIAHEYGSDKVIEIYKNLLEITPEFLSAVRRVITIINNQKEKIK